MEYSDECRRYVRYDHVQTRGGRKALAIAEEHRIVSIIGRSGDGKSSIAKWLVHKLLTTEYEVIVVRSLEDWKYYVDSKRKQIVVIEDIFGYSPCDLTKRKHWLDAYTEIDLALDEYLLYIVITSNTAVYKEASIPQSMKVFRHILDLTDPNYKLTPSEMKTILTRHIYLNKITMSSLKDESLVFVEDDSLGFPQCSHMFCSEDYFQEFGIGYFEHPSSHITELLKHLSRKEPLKFCALVICMLHGGSIPKKCLQEMNHCPKVEMACKSCGLQGLEPVRLLVDQMDQLLSRHLVTGSMGVAFKMQHKSTLDALVDVYCEYCRGHDVILKHGDLTFIANNVLIDNWDVSQGSNIHISAIHYEQVWNRMVDELNQETRLNLVLDSLMMKNKDVVSFYIRKLMKDNELIPFLEQNNDFLLKSNIHEYSSNIECRNMALMKEITNAKAVHHILSAKTIVSKKQMVSLLLLWSAFVGADRDVILHLLAHEADPNIQGNQGITPLHCAVQVGSMTVVHELLIRGAHQTATSDTKMTPIHRAAQGGRNNITSLLLAHGAKVITTDIRNCSALDLAAQNGHTETSSLLLDYKGNLIVQESWVSSSLNKACRYGHPATIHLLMARGANITYTDQKGFTPLHWASREGHTDVVAILLTQGASPTAITKKGSTPLHLASQEGHTNVARLLLQRGANINVLNNKKHTPLHLASTWGQNEVIGLLLKQGASCTEVCANDCTPLHHACQGGHVDTIRLLLESGASHTSVSKDGFTSLKWASGNGQTESVGVLLEQGANIAGVTNGGYTPLHWASQYGHTETVRVLLEQGADHNATDKWRFSPLHRACKRGHTDAAMVLLEHCANIELVNMDGYTPLHCASQLGHAETVGMLLEHRANIEAVTKNGHSPLHCASHGGHSDAARLLLEHGADHSVVDGWGYSPLHEACYCGNTGTVSILLDHGANHSALSKLRFTPLDLAYRNDHAATIRLLQERGATKSKCCIS